MDKNLDSQQLEKRETIYKIFKKIILVFIILSALILFGYFWELVFFKILVDPVFLIPSIVLAISWFGYDKIKKKIFEITCWKKINKLDNVDKNLYPTVFSFKLSPFTRSYLVKEILKKDDQNVDDFFKEQEAILRGYEVKLKKSFDNMDLQNKVEQEIDSLDPIHFPKLIEWRRANRNRLIEVILNEMVDSPNDSIGMALINYESDLEHLSPTINRKIDET